MNVTIHSEKNKGYIATVGTFENEEDSSEFIRILCNASEDILEVTFLDLWYLPPEIIELLSDFPALFPPKKLKVFTLNRQLYSYLFKLSINCNFVSQKVLYKKERIRDVDVLALGGSAESLEKIYEIIDRLPVEDITVFIIQHIREEGQTLLHDLLQKRTDYAVSLAADKMKVEKKHVYIAPSGFQMKVAGGMISLSKEAPVHFARPSIDVLFSSLAQEYGSRLIAFLLSGYGCDGVESLSLLKQSGSTIIIEDPKGCEKADVLPRNGIASGNFHYIMDIKEGGRYLFHQFGGDDISEKSLGIFLEDIFEKYGYDFRSYSHGSLKRRIESFMRMEHHGSFGEMAIEIMEKPDYFEKFLIELSVNVTQFFRDPDIYRVLADEILPSFSKSPNIKIWSAGCATGEEPFSVSILLNEANLLDKTYIYATDINPHLLSQAKNGLFSAKMQKENEDAYLKSNGKKSFMHYFEEKPGYIKARDCLKNRILFFTHSLTNAGLLNEFDIIFCRNVMIYCDPTLQLQFLQLFHRSMHEESKLIIGKGEKIVSNEGKQLFRKHGAHDSVLLPVYP